MKNLFTFMLNEDYVNTYGLDRVREDFRDQVLMTMKRHLLPGKKLEDFKPSKLHGGTKVVGGSFMYLCAAAFKVFDEGIVEELLTLSGGKRPSAGPGEILLTALFSNVRSASKGDVVIDGQNCEIKSIRGGGGPYDRSALKDKLKTWSVDHKIDLSGVEWNPSGIGALLPILHEMDDEAMADLAPLLVGNGMGEVFFKELKKADELGPRILLQHMGACQLKNYCDKQDKSDLLIVFPEEKKYLWCPNVHILEVGDYVKFGGWSQFGLLISKLNVG